MWLTKDEIFRLGIKTGEDVKIDNKAMLINPSALDIGDHSRIDAFSFLSGDIVIGRYCHIPPFCILSASSEVIRFGDFVTLSPGVKIFTATADPIGLTNPTIPQELRSNEIKPIWIGDHVIIFTNSVVLPGANIQDGAVFGAFSLIKGAIYPGWTFYSGIPARYRKRRPQEKVLEDAKKLLSLL